MIETAIETARRHNEPVLVEPLDEHNQRTVQNVHPDNARERAIPVRTFVQELRKVDRAVLDGEPEGFVKVHVKEGTDRILGATIVASHAGEMLSELTLAIQAGVGLSTIAGTIHPYPTQAEAIRKTGALYSRTRLTPSLKGLFERWLAWSRR